MIYKAPESARFLSAVLKLKQEQRQKERRTRVVKQKVRILLRKLRGD